MKHLKQSIKLLLFLSLTINTLLIQAQSELGVAGSGIVIPLIEQLVTASESEISIATTVTGTSAGFESFCAGDSPITTATRPMTVDEEQDCKAENTEYAELLIGHNIIAFITHPEANIVQCLSQNDLDTLFAPSSTQILDWSQINPDVTETPLSLIIPQDDTQTYAVLDLLIGGDGIRRDAVVLDGDTNIIDTVITEPGAIGVVDYLSAVQAQDTIQILDINFGSATGCVSPSPQNVENRLYGAAQRLFVYANTALLDDTAIETFLSFISSDQAEATIEGLGFSTPSIDTYAANAQVIISQESGRQFSQDLVEFRIPPNLSGQINIGGSANAYQLLSALGTDFTGQQPGITVDFRVEGLESGIRRLCNGELDIAITNSDLTSEQAVKCDANQIETVFIPLGVQATVLLANTEDDYAVCLNTQHIHTIWEASSTSSIMQWSDVDPAFPQADMTLFGVAEGDIYTDILLTSADGSIPPARIDTEVDRDPLYRAAATANVTGALTYMSWSDYESVLANNQAGIQLIAIDSGSGCVAPTEESILDGTYPLIRQAGLVVSRSSLADINVQSLLWFMFSDESFFALDSANYVGFSFGDLLDIRTNLQEQFDLALEIVAETETSSSDTDTQNDTTSADDTSNPEAESTESAETNNE